MRPRLLALAALALACVPLPHHEADAPELFGTVTRDGQPAADLEVVLATDAGTPDCAEPRARSRTDAKGRFHFERPQQFDLFFVYGDRMASWRVCFVNGQKLEPAFDGHGWFGGPATQTLTCTASPAKCEALPEGDSRGA